MAKKASSKHSKKGLPQKRGILLTTLLLLAVLGIGLSGFSLFYKFASGYHSSALNLPFWYPIYEVMGILLSAGMVYGIWMFKKWGVFLLIIRFMIAVIFDLVIVAGMQTLTSSFLMATALGEILFIALWWLAIKPRWKLFT